VNRALRAATMGVLLLSPVALSACGSGQVTQTATQERDKTGAQAQVGDITLRQVQLAYPSGGIYQAGDDARLIATIVNSGARTDTLTGVSGQGFASAEISGKEIRIPTSSTVFVGQGDLSVTLTHLDRSLATGQAMVVTLTFANAGAIDVPLSVANPTRTVDRGKAFDFNQGRVNSGQVARSKENTGSS
jgi:copper(I)-binding protein